MNHTQREDGPVWTKPNFYLKKSIPHLPFACILKKLSSESRLMALVLGSHGSGI